MRKEAKDDPLKKFSTINGPGTGHEAQNPASYVMMMMMMMKTITMMMMMMKTITMMMMKRLLFILEAWYTDIPRLTQFQVTEIQRHEIF